MDSHNQETSSPTPNEAEKYQSSLIDSLPDWFSSKLTDEIVVSKRTAQTPNELLIVIGEITENTTPEQYRELDAILNNFEPDHVVSWINNGNNSQTTQEFFLLDESRGYTRTDPSYERTDSRGQLFILRAGYSTGKDSTFVPAGSAKGIYGVISENSQLFSPLTQLSLPGRMT